MYLCLLRCFGLLNTIHPPLRQAHHRLIRPRCGFLSFWGPAEVLPSQPEPPATVFCWVWNLFDSLAKGLAKISQLLKQLKKHAHEDHIEELFRKVNHTDARATCVNNVSFKRSEVFFTTFRTLVYCQRCSLCSLFTGYSTLWLLRYDGGLQTNGM